MSQHYRVIIPSLQRCYGAKLEQNERMRKNERVKIEIIPSGTPREGTAPVRTGSEIEEKINT